MINNNNINNINIINHGLPILIIVDTKVITVTGYSLFLRKFCSQHIQEMISSSLYKLCASDFEDYFPGDYHIDVDFSKAKEVRFYLRFTSDASRTMWLLKNTELASNS